MTKKEAIAIVTSYLNEMSGDYELSKLYAKRIVESLPIKGIRS